MKLYYTVIQEEGLPQSRTDLSLGGFKSSTPIPSNRFSNLFDDLSCYSVTENQNEYIGIMLMNDSVSEITNVTLYFVYPEVDSVNVSQKILELAPVALDSNNQMESITNPYSAPYLAEFHEADGVANAINIGSIPASGLIGLWIKRRIDVDKIDALYTDTSLEENGNPAKANEDISLMIVWD